MLGWKGRWKSRSVFLEWAVGDAQSPRGAACARRLHFLGEQKLEDLRSGRVGVVEMMGEPFSCGRHAEIGEVASQLLIGGGGHVLTRA